MAISFGSINTGLPKDIVKQIMEAEKLPLKTMEVRKGKVAEKKALVDQLIQLVNGVSTNLAQNSNARSLRELKVETREDLIKVTADKNKAEPGSYQLEVLQMAKKSSAMTSGFEDPDNSYLGVGFVQYYLPNGETRDIYVDSDNSSLNKIAKLINADQSNGMRANVINDGSGSDTPWRLILSLEETGDEQRAEFPYLYFVDGEKDFFVEYERKAQDAVVKLDGFEIELPANNTSELIPGVTIDFLKAAPGEEFTIKIGEDIEAISAKITDLVTKINDVLKFIKEQNTMDENTDTSRTLGGDIMLQTLESRIRGAIFKDIQTKYGFRRVSDLGLTFQKDGLLSLDEKRLNSAVAENYTLASQILTGYFPEEGGKTRGFIDNIDDVIKSSLRSPDGLLPSRKKTLQSNIDRIDSRISQKQRTLEQKEKNLKDKFARLEGTISRLKTQGAGIAGLGAQANGPVQQLG